MDQRCASAQPRPQKILILPQGLFQASHLAGENDLRGIIRSLQIDTFIATGTPPQAAGVNSNTERVAGSERITNFALDSFDRRGGLPSHCAVQPRRLCLLIAQCSRAAGHRRTSARRNLWRQVWRSARRGHARSAHAHPDGRIGDASGCEGIQGALRQLRAPSDRPLTLRRCKRAALTRSGSAS